MAETNATNTNANENNGAGNDQQQGAKTPSVEELLQQLATEKAEREKLKLSNDKLSKSEAEMKRQLRAKLTTEEQEAEARKEADEKRQQDYENALAELNQIKAEQAYANVLSEEKVVSNIISAVADGDHKSIALIIKSECEKAVKNAQVEWLKSRPQPQSGQYSGMSKEQIMAITDREERRKAIASNLDMFS